jgi:hypothetical protein
MAPLLVLSFWVGPFSPYNAVGLGVGLLVGAVIFPDGIMAAFERRLAPESLGGDAGVAAAALPPIQVAGKASAAGAQRDSQPIVEAIGVTKSFGGNRALAGVDFRMQRGALVGLVGPNGSGKSTFLNAVSGFLTCDAGSIRINGAPTTNLPPFRVARSGVGRTFQVPQLIEEFTVVENIEIGLVAGEPRALLGSLFRNRRASLRDGHRRKRALEVFELLALPPGACDLPVSSLPLGLKRVAVVDYDVHHGNGTEAQFLQRDDVLFVSIHQDRLYPLDTGDVKVVGEGAGRGYVSAPPFRAVPSNVGERSCSSSVRVFPFPFTPPPLLLVELERAAAARLRHRRLQLRVRAGRDARAARLQARAHPRLERL